MIKADNWTFAYPYKGKFLPSLNDDGYYWKSSQGTKKCVRALVKRYFYATNNPSGMKIKRSVYWIDKRDSYQFVEYSCSNLRSVFLSSLQGPPTMDWSLLIKLSQQQQRGTVVV